MDSMSFLFDKSNAVLSHVTPSEDGRKEIDPIMIISIILMIVEMVMKCRKNREEATKTVREPGFFEEAVTRVAIKRKMGRRLYREKGDEVMKGLRELGGNTTAADMDRYFQAVMEKANDRVW